VVVTRRDLTPGQQAVQATHAAIDFVFFYPELAKKWHDSNYLIEVTVNDLQELTNLIELLELSELKYAAFTEPDLNDELTALCIEPSNLTQKLISNLPLL
jgi:hypothetical protein